MFAAILNIDMLKKHEDDIRKELFRLEHKAEINSSLTSEEVLWLITLINVMYNKID